MANGGKLTIRTSNVTVQDAVAANTPGMPLGDYVLLTVADTGTGITPEVLEKIFDPFFTPKRWQGHRPRPFDCLWHHQADGRLHLLRFRGRHGHDVPHLPAEGRSGRGRGGSAAPAADAAKPKAADLTGQGTILLVEDEEAVRRFAERALTQRGYSVWWRPMARMALRSPMTMPGRLISCCRMCDAGNGRTQHAARTAQGPARCQVRVHVRPCGRRVREEPRSGAAIRLHLKAFNLKDLAETVKKAIQG